MSFLRRNRRLAGGLVTAAFVLAARADLPPFLQHAMGSTPIEAALYRLMQTPALQALYPRPPKEAQAQLGVLIAQTPGDAQLLAWRARSEEQALDFTAAETDWKACAAHAVDAGEAQLELSDFYHRRLAVSQEMAALTAAAAGPAPVSERFLAPHDQRAWHVYERLLALIADQALPPATADAVWKAFLSRYPGQPQLYTRYLRVLLDRADYTSAQQVIALYAQAFPQDRTFPIAAGALIAYRRGDAGAAIQTYSHSFDPLWNQTLVTNLYTLLDQTHRARSFLADAEARQARSPDDLNALARIFYYYQQPDRSGASGLSSATPRSMALALQALDRFRVSKESRKAAWSPLDLETLARLSALAGSPSEAARYDYALASTPGTLPTTEPAAQAGLAALVAVLLSAPDQPFALGSANLTMYRDIATLDQGPGYWNGILSLWLNGTSPATEYAEESAKAQPYFHRAKAAELLAELDRRFPAAPERAGLHAQLLAAEAVYGDPAAVVADGKAFLVTFPQSTDRLQVTTLVANAYARQKNTAAEFALYDSLLSELLAETAGQPLSARGQKLADPDQTPVAPDETPSAPAPELESLSLTDAQPVDPNVRQALASAEYSQVLEIYLTRLTALHQLPQALALMRRQLDQSPADPALYERLAAYLQQNNLSADQEQIYKDAIAHFDSKPDNQADTSWYDRLARLYLREKKSQDFAALTRQVTTIFSGTELDRWFAKVDPAAGALGPQLALQLNLYAAKRFPHDLVFTDNLLNAYSSGPTANQRAWEALLRAHWWESASLRDRLFEFLSRTGRLDAETAQLQALAGAESDDPAAARELAEADIWASHFEQAAPLMGSLAAQYPADADVGDRAVSLFRSFSYLETGTASLTRAAQIETNLLAAAPDSPDRLGTLGDLHAEATETGGEDLPAAAPYWRTIPKLHPGLPDGYLTAATIFWDYFQFSDALAELSEARTHLHQPALYGYEAGAIEESAHDLPGAIREYTAAVLHPPAVAVTAAGADEATGAPADPARARLLQLARRPAGAALVDQASAAAVQADPSEAALGLRVDVLIAQRRQAELASALGAGVARAGTTEQAAAVGALAQSHGLTAVYEQALGRQIALSQDPVQQIQLQLALARSFEDRHDLADANRTIETVYRGSPRLLGVVRATVDYENRTQQSARAVATLLEAATAAKSANPELARSFTLEAAQTANAAGDTVQARSLAEGLLATSPYDARFLAVVAQSYARNGDTAGLRDFYLARLALVKADAGLTPDQRRQDTALLRRGLIPALERSKDDSGVIDQYIALITAYPEDAGTAQQAALYALAHGRQAQLVGFLQVTVKASPRDSRFSILLAQVDSTFSDFAGSLAAYSQAISIRKDRVDLYTARADLEIRLGQPDAAAEDYGRLYQLTYRDPAWMARLARLRASQQRPADAVKALQTAYIIGRTPAPANDFNVAAHLERWNLLTEARTFAEQGVKLAGPNLLASPVRTASSDESSDASDTEPDADTDADPGEGAVAASSESSPNASGAALYGRILARMGEPEQALATLVSARQNESAATPGLLAAALAHVTLSPQDKASTRDDLRKQRQSTIEQSFQAALAGLSAAVKDYGTPEVKQRYGLLLDQRHAADPNPEPWIATAGHAGLADRQAAWMRQALLAPGNGGEAYLAPYIALERARLRFQELAATLESYAKGAEPDRVNSLLSQAAQFYQAAEDGADEMRVERRLFAVGDTQQRDRFFDLLLQHDANALAALAADGDAKLADAAADYAVAHASAPAAFAAVAGRARSVGPLWGTANTALTGLWLASEPAARSPDRARLVDMAFRQTLGSDQTVGDRLAAPVDPHRQLTGDLWFVYGADYGVYRETISTAGDPEEFAAAALEGYANQVAPYLQLARTYDEAGKPDQAFAEYGHALELSPDRAETYDDLAQLQSRTGHSAEALASWRAGLGVLSADAEKGSYPERFWAEFTAVAGSLHQAGRTAQLRPEILAVLRPYLTGNANYRDNELLAAAYRSSATPAEGVALVLAAAEGLPQESAILSGLDDLPWLCSGAAEAVLQRQIVLRQQASAGTLQGSSAELARFRERLARLYLDGNQLTEARQVLAQLPRAAPVCPDGSSPEAGGACFDGSAPKESSLKGEALELELAVRSGQLSGLLAAWEVSPGATPAGSALDAALSSLRRATPAYQPDASQIRPFAEFVFERKRLADTLLSTDYLSLAQTRIETGDLPGALTLLNRLALLPVTAATVQTAYVSSSATIGADDLSEAPDEDYDGNLNAAARLLESTHHLAEAIPFLKMLVTHVPWNAEFQLRLSTAQLDDASTRTAAVQGLESVARDAPALYQTRVHAAELLAGQHAAAAGPATGLGSAELDLVAGAKAPQASQVNQPYFSAARVAAAAADHAAARQLLQDALAADPDGPEAGHTRLALLQVDLDMGQNASAVALVGSVEATPQPSEDADQESGSTTEPSQSLPAAAFVSILDMPGQIRLLERLATAYRQQGELAIALADLKAVHRLTGSSPQNAPPDLPRRMVELEAAMALKQKNELRRPLIQETLDQIDPADTSNDAEPHARQVRPRLLTEEALQRGTP